MSSFRPEARRLTEKEIDEFIAAVNGARERKTFPMPPAAQRCAIAFWPRSEAFADGFVAGQRDLARRLSTAYEIISSARAGMELVINAILIDDLPK